ncbi:hypothetical protein DICPUDRAFT_150797 [Dictyostelium purpureum]|uniref:THH1/TOM1/TOM3 domain-containing protein n=1 Tax=Dictyostelium purpureum TaxID=5786 RepID=F0ZH99_DICPU|nr:uncharacterized protein DICPUDRAFT_150797 [Dictyostelium purpureum]EGC36700.1 hypothetical protein DICPUDRAFT_150797 [Dictyostelium purpureum]|eukprot:XP_003286799.1 hypothetical protein DICPUDRAFT_150797 [Dictyostelium purpureum]
MGTDISYALYDISFDDDLYKHSSVGCPLFSDGPNFLFDDSTDSCFCDFTVSNNPEYPLSCPVTLSCKVKEPNVEAEEWVSLSINGSTNNFSINKQTQFRFNNNRKSLGFSIKVTPIKGSFTMYYTEDLKRRVFESLNDNILLSVCPNSYNTIEGTYFIDILPVTPESQFSIELDFMDVPTIVEGDTITKSCVNQYEDQECLGLGQFIKIYSSNLYFIEINDPGYYFVSLKSSGEANLFISDDSSIKNLNEENSKYILKNVGNSNFAKSLTVYIEKPTVLFLNMVCPNKVCLIMNFFPELYIVKSQKIFLKKISSMGFLEGSLALSSSSRIQIQNKYFSCTDSDSCYPYSILFPSQTINPLYPVPAALHFIQDFDYRTIEYNGSEINFKEKSYQFAVIRSINYGKGIIEYLKPEDVSKVKVEFLNTIFDSNDNPINLIVSDFSINQLNESNCDINKFNGLQEQINKGMNNNGLSTEKFNSWKYNLGIIQSSSDWIQCENLILSYLNLETVKYNISSSQCIYSQSEPGYKQDPCCNFHLLFNKACESKVAQFETFKVKELQSDKVSQECFSQDCTSIILNNFATQKFLLRENDGCKVSGYDILKTHLNSYTTLRECRRNILLEIPDCGSDSDCQDFSQGTRKCDLFKRKCVVNYEITDKNYIECVLENLSSGTLYSLISSLQINSTVIDSIYNRLTIKDWVIEAGEPKHSTYIYYLEVSEASFNPNLIDYSNEISYKSPNQVRGWEFEKENYFFHNSYYGNLNSEEINCLAYLKMLPKGYSQEVISDFLLFCDDASPENTVHSFCGYCSDQDNTYCHIYNGSLSHVGSPQLTYGNKYPFSESDVLVDEAECNQGLSMCLLKDGDYLPNIDKENCENNYGSCSSPCGYECKGVQNKCIWAPIFYYNSNEGTIIMDSNKCQDEGFTYDADELCNTGIDNESECILGGYTWLDCPSKDIDNCIGPNFNLTDPDSDDSNNFYRSKCYLKEIPCQTKEDCLNQGKCSDYDIFYDQVVLDDYFPYPNGLGKCIKDYSVDTIYGKSCDPDIEYDSPMGCYPITSIPGKEVCDTQKGKWWKPSTSKEECESHMGCKTFDYIYQNNQEIINPYNLPFTSRFNQMDQQNCLLQQNQSGTQWVNRFKWSNAVWYPGVHVTSQWYYNKSFVNRIQYKDTFDYIGFYNDIVSATQKQVSILYSSEAYCQKEKNENYMNSILCSCSEDGGSNCFNSTNRIMVQTIVCNSETKSLLFENGNVSFTDSSAPYGCEMVSVSHITKFVFSVSSPQPLSNNFISYLKPDDYAVLNSKDAIIGTLLDDGIILKSEYGLSEIRICMTFNGTNPNESKYPILDFAIKTNNSNLEPYGSVAEEEIYDSITYYCSTIINITSYQVIYPMNRVSDWQNQDRKVLDTKSTAIVYVLASLFLLVGVYGLLQIVEFIVFKFKNKTPFQLTHLLITSITAFILIRSFYFYVLPSGRLTDFPASDYVLVVLPTFIYLSSFSILIILWYVIVFFVLKFNPAAGNMKKRLYAIVSTTNTIIYMFFIAIVIVFQYTPYQPNNDCVSLIFEELKNSNSQEAVSIAYSVVQAFISLFIGLAFFYLGSKIIKEMKRVNLGGIYSNNQPKIKALTAICGAGFILHCIFIILISIRSVKYIVFTFIGLIITEIIPAIAILYLFDNRFAKSSTNSDKSTTDKSKGITLNTVTTETNTESSELYINKKQTETGTNTESSEYKK